MTKLTLLALLALSLPAGAASADTVAPVGAALSPYTATRLGRKPRSVRAEHCARKADSVGVEGKARAIYLRKCGNG
ncbi:hypothetical protein [Lichenibacterium dinghuense]|uniref:hypothetical protein n=1 Tax=Lichenibacterium dinghuense TaxID=2895977 RepID=UPI001F39DBE0|nr:hypothetical protein [Lichenibacterium sp. 6Y81]